MGAAGFGEVGGFAGLFGGDGELRRRAVEVVRPIFPFSPPGHGLALKLGDFGEVAYIEVSDAEGVVFFSGDSVHELGEAVGG